MLDVKGDSVMRVNVKGGSEIGSTTRLSYCHVSLPHDTDKGILARSVGNIEKLSPRFPLCASVGTVVVPV